MKLREGVYTPSFLLTKHGFRGLIFILLIRMVFMKNALKTVGVVFLLIFIALCFGFNAFQKGYQITLSSFLIGTTHSLGPDFSLKITVPDQIMSVLYVILWAVIPYRAEKKGKKYIFRGMMIYSALPFIGLIGYYFLQKGMKLGILMLMPLIWGYPLFPMIITRNSIDAIVYPIGVAMFLFPVIALVSRWFARQIQV